MECVMCIGYVVNNVIIIKSLQVGPTKRCWQICVLDGVQSFHSLRDLRLRSRKRHQFSPLCASCPAIRWLPTCLLRNLRCCVGQTSTENGGLISLLSTVVWFCTILWQQEFLWQWCKFVCPEHPGIYVLACVHKCFYSAASRLQKDSIKWIRFALRRVLRRNTAWHCELTDQQSSVWEDFRWVVHCSRSARTCCDMRTSVSRTCWTNTFNPRLSLDRAKIYLRGNIYYAMPNYSPWGIHCCCVAGSMALWESSWSLVGSEYHSLVDFHWAWEGSSRQLRAGTGLEGQSQWLSQ